MLRNRCTWILSALIPVLSMAGAEVIAQGFIDNFNRPDQDGPPAGWSAFRGEWTITDGALVGESSNFDNNTLREAWIWAGQPPVELPSALELSFDMNFLTDSDVGDRNGRHAGVFFCSSRPTHRWDREGGINGYCLDWIDRAEDRGVRLVRIDGGNQTVLRNTGGKLRGPPLHWRVVLDAATIRVWGDDELIMEIDDGSYRGGHLGFWVWSNGTRVAYDNVMTGNAALLPLGEQRTVQLQPGVDGEDTTAFYFTAHREAGAPGNTIVVSLDGQEGDENALLMAWGRGPTKNDYDLAADVRGQADQRLVIPFARDDLAYVVPYAKRGGGAEGNGFNSVTLQAELPGILLDGLSVESAFRPSPGGSAGRVTTSVFGAGFTAETSFLFSGQAGAGIAVVETQFVSSSHVLLTLELGGRTLPGLYQLQAGNGDVDSAQLQDAFLVEGGEAAPGVLEVSLIAAGEVRPFRSRPLQVRYSNSGGGTLALRLLRIHPPAGVQLKLAGDYAFAPPDVPVDILTVNSVGYPGSLPSGASGVQNLVYMVISVPDPGIEGSELLEFTVEVLSPRCVEAGPGCAPRLLTKPEDMPASAWARMGDVVGDILSDFIVSLWGLSTRVALRGGNPASVSEALQLAAHTAWTLEDPGNHFSAALSGILRDSFGNPLAEVSVAAVRVVERACAVTSASGFFVIEGLQGGPGVYQLEAEGFSLSSTGVVAAGGEASLGSVVAVGQASNSPFECEIFANSLQVAPLTTSPDRLVSVANISVEIIIPIDPNYKSGTAGQSTVREVDLGDIVPKGKDLSGVQAKVWIPYADDGVVSQ
ncbi:MAG: carboxypeptidase-like regulatory domain-containing protein, partial [Planctomycetes bacterium]|nr:carboxypeptidase-like regulatory domain-containing protein [Planctomycetota bacterium]